MDKKNNWILDDILKPEEFDKFYQETETRLSLIDTWLKKIKPSMEDEEFKKLIEDLEELGERMSRMGYLAHLRIEVNQKDAEARLWETKINDLGLKIATKSRLISHWLKGKKVEGLEVLDDKNAKRLFGVIKDLEHSLNRSRELAKYTLDSDKEDIISHKDSFGVGQLINLRGLIETGFEYEVLGKKIKTLAEVTTLFRSEKAEEREASYKSLLTVHKDNIDKFFLIYQGVVKDWGYEAKLRGYSNPIAMRNVGNEIPNEAVETLLEVCRGNRSIYQRYFKLKAKEMGVNKLKRVDLYAPTKTVDKEITYEKAVEMVLSTLGEFSNEFKDRAEKIISEKHIDVWPKENKRGGAFCATVSPKVSPYILLNHTNKLNDVYTLAHELGHGIHSLFANHHHPSVQHSNLPLAETASTMSEMIMFEKIFSQESDNDVKRAMLMERMADSYATILRQNYIVVFEQEAHKMIEKGITHDQLSEIWMDTLKEQFGDSVEIDNLFAYEWSYISHIVNSPFYCYAYNFGELLSLALYEKYRMEGAEFVKEIIKILKSGGAEDPTLLLSSVGVDIKSKDFWQNSFKVIDDWQTKLENS